MARAGFPNQMGFNSGEFSPLLCNRSDQARYAYGVKRMRNFIPTLQGPARKRPRTTYLCNVREPAWCVPFVAGQTDSYIILFRNSTVRFVTDHGYVLESAKTITGATQASPGVIHAAGHGYSNGDEVYLTGITGMVELNGRNFTVTVVDADHFTLTDLWGVAVNTTGYAAYISGGTAARVYQIVSPYAYSDITDSTTGCCLISFAQSDDVVYLCVPGFAPRKLTRTAPASWAFSTLDQTGGPFKGTDPDETITVYAGASTGSGVTLTASSAIFLTGHIGGLFLLERESTEITTSWEVGKLTAVNTVRRSQGHYYKALNDGKTTGTITPSHTEGSRYDGDDGVNWQYLHSGYGWAKITAIGGGGTTATVDILSYIPEGAVGGGNASTTWAFGEWSTEYGFPTHVTFFRERLTFARGTKLWFSVPDDFENFSERDAGVIAADSSFVIDVRSGTNDSIQWVIPAADLLVGTQGLEKSISEITTSDAFGPTNSASLDGPGFSSRRVVPVRVNDDVMYATASGRLLRSLRFQFQTDGYVSLNLVAFAEHIAKGQINQLAYVQEPQANVWACCADGSLIGLSWELEHELQAWHAHTLGGSGLVKSLARIPSPSGERDELNLVVQRTINSQTVYYLEYLEADWDPDVDAVTAMKYADCGLTYSGSATTTIRNFDHLEGESVQLLVGGRAIGAKTVSAGAITLDSSATDVQGGLGYTATLQSMNVAQPGMIARIAHAFIRFIGTIYAKFGDETAIEHRSETKVRDMNFDFANLALAAPSAVTKMLKADGQGPKGGHEVSWIIEHDRPTACTVAGVILDLQNG